MLRGWRSVRFTVLAALAVGLLAGCGFHLRGSVVLPETMERTYLEGAPADSALAGEVRAALESSGGEVVNRLADATAVLHLGDENMDRRIASVDSAGKVREYSLRYTLPFRLLTPGGDVLLSRRTVETARSYNFDPANVLGAGAEETILLREMRGFAVRQMLRQVRMAAVNGFPSKSGADEPAKGSP